MSKTCHVNDDISRQVCNYRPNSKVLFGLPGNLPTVFDPNETKGINTHLSNRSFSYVPVFGHLRWPARDDVTSVSAQGLVIPAHAQLSLQSKGC